jgi:hypothetical protein
MLTAAAKERRLATLKKGKEMPVVTKSSQREKVADQIAEMANVGGGTVRQAQYVRRRLFDQTGRLRCSPDALEGTISILREDVFVVSRQPAEQVGGAVTAALQLVYLVNK